MDERMEWVDAFVLTMVQLGVQAENQHIIEMARELYPDHKDKDPVKVAEAEYEEWPPHDD